MHVIIVRPTKEVRVKYNVDYPHDKEFLAYARPLKSIWRDKKGYPDIGLGNSLELEFAKTSKANYKTSSGQDN